MKYLFICIASILLLSSCQKNDLSEQFNCNTSNHFTNTKQFKDVLKKFKIKIPKYWKTELYYDDSQSELYSADTTKQLSETYLIDISWHQGELNFDKDFEENISKDLKAKGLLMVKHSGYTKFKKYDSYYNLSKGINAELTYHYVQIYMKYKPDEFFTFTSKIYGDEFVDERICASISLFNRIKFIKH